MSVRASWLQRALHRSSGTNPVYFIIFVIRPQQPIGSANEKNVYSTENSNWPVIDSYVTGQVIEIDVIIEYYHAVSGNKRLTENLTSQSDASR